MREIAIQKSKRNQRGATTVLFTFVVFFVVIPTLGLAIDGAIVMWEKARLSASVDAAALAAGRSLSVGQDLPSQTTNATQTALNYFNANFIPGHMSTSIVGGQPTVAVQQTSNSTRTITIDATINVPLYFLRVIGFSNSTLTAHGQASRRDVNIVMVLDRSGSIAQSGSCGPLIASAQTFGNMFVDGRDQLGLVTFSTTGNSQDYAPTTYFKSQTPSLNSVLSTLVCAGNTNSAEGLSLAYQQIKNAGKPGAFNAVVFFSDGYPTALTFGTTGFGTQPGNPLLPVITTLGIAAGATDTRYGPAPRNAGVPDFYTPSATKVSSCTATGLAGVIASGSGQTPDPNGMTVGVLDPSPIPINSSASNNLKPINSTGCSFADTQDWGVNAPIFVRNDVAYLPDMDAYGNSTASFLASRPLSNLPQANDRFFYAGLLQIRPDTPKAIINAAFIAADNAAYRIRNDNTYNTVVYTIGLGANVDTELMQRMANDPQSTSFDSTKTAGFYRHAPTANELQAAFSQVASQILRISQ